MGRIEKTVFISYRRTATPWPQAIFQDLHQNGYDVFFDLQGLASGDFESVILENIRARAHFLVLLTPSSLDRCENPSDLFRREIEEAIANNRNVVPVMLDGFDFSAAGIDKQLGDSLASLKAYNGLTIYPEYFGAAMEKLRNKFLSVPLETILLPASPSATHAAHEEQEAAAKAPPVTQELLKEAGERRHLFTIKLV
jgi:hypothetical protein